MITITEGLAEIKTIQARLDKRQEAVLRFLARDARLRDPLEAEGGSIEFVRRERQAIGDLEDRIVKIRTAIQGVNLATQLSVNNRAATVSEWLNWRRDVSGRHGAFLNVMNQTIAQARQKATQQGARLTDQDAAAKPGDFIISVSERELAEAIEEQEIVLGELDGKLSLLNATTTIDV